MSRRTGPNGACRPRQAVSSLLLGLLLLACSAACRLGPDTAARTAGAPNEPELPSVGASAKMQGWEVTLLKFGLYERLAPDRTPAPDAHDVLVVADLRIRNLQNRPDDFTPRDFVLRVGDGRQVTPAAETAQIERGLSPRETLQPGQTTERRVVFEVPPDAQDLVLEALELEFSVPAPRS